MSHRVRLDRLSFASVQVTDWTEWTFATLHDDQGVAATVEITCGDYTTRVVARLTELKTALADKIIAEETDIVNLLGLTSSQLFSDRVLGTAVSGLRTALADLISQHEKLGLTQTLEGEPQQSVALYANINRSLFGGARTPQAFGAAAERAVAEGYAVVKCAPFDEVSPPSTAAEITALARPGIERVAAVRRAVGPDVQILVDCHSRFEVHTAPLVAEDLTRLDVGWFEEPLQPTKDAGDLAEVTEVVQMPVAGGESGYGEAFFADLVSRGAVSIIMPDIKHCGGVVEACRAGKSAIGAGRQFSLHSPSGPISQLAGAHVTAAVAGAMPLEHAVNEADWRADLLEPRERIEDGRLWFPGGMGLGAMLNASTVNRYGRHGKP